MKQSRIFVSASSGTRLDIKDDTVQAILKSGNKVAFFYNDNIYYASSPSQSQWWNFQIEQTPVVLKDQNVYNDSAMEDFDGNEVELFNITKKIKTNANGEFLEFTIADNGFVHNSLLYSHIGDLKAYVLIPDIENDEHTEDIIDTPKVDFQNVLATIFKQTIISSNHNIDGTPQESITPTSLIRKYNENNLVEYAMHTNQMSCIDNDGNEISFENIQAGCYKFPVAKLVFPSSNKLNNVQHVSVTAYNDYLETYYIAKCIVTSSTLSIISENRESYLSERDIYITYNISDNIATIYLNILFSDDYNENEWTCSANISGSEGTRFYSRLKDKAYGVVGTSYDCFNNKITLDEYVSTNICNCQERYKVKSLIDKGYPYVIKINISPNDLYESYIPDFTSDEDKSYNLFINGEPILNDRYTTSTADNHSIYYNFGYEIPQGDVLFHYRDMSSGEEYTAFYNNADLSASQFIEEDIDGNKYRALDVDVIVDKGRAILDDVDGISFLSLITLPSPSSSMPEYYNVSDNTDMNTLGLTVDADGKYKTLDYQNDRNTSSLLGVPPHGYYNNYFSNVGFDENCVNVRCSGSDNSSFGCMASFPYIKIPRKVMTQHNNIKNNIYTSVAPKIANNDYTLDNLDTALNELYGDRASISEEEFATLDTTDLTTYVNGIAELLANKLLANWNGRVVSTRLAYFYHSHPYFDDKDNREAKGTYYVKHTSTSNFAQHLIAVFSLYRDKKRDDEMDITLDDIEGGGVVYSVSASGSALNKSFGAPLYLNRRLNGSTYRYKLSNMQEINNRVLEEFAYAYYGKSATSTWKSVTPAFFPFLYKIEPDNENSKTIDDYPKDDYLLGDSNFPASMYDPSDMGKGQWLMLNPVLHTKDGKDVYTNSFPDGVLFEEYHKDTHIIKRDGAYYYATPTAVHSSSASTYEELDSDFINKATKYGLPLFAIVFFDVKSVYDVDVITSKAKCNYGVYEFDSSENMNRWTFKYHKES